MTTSRIDVADTVRTWVSQAKDLRASGRSGAFEMQAVNQAERRFGPMEELYTQILLWCNDGVDLGPIDLINVLKGYDTSDEHGIWQMLIDEGVLVPVDGSRSIFRLAGLS